MFSTVKFLCFMLPLFILMCLYTIIVSHSDGNNREMFKKKDTYIRISLAQKLFFFLVSMILLTSALSYTSNTLVYKQNMIQQSEEYHKNIINQVITNIDSYYKLLDNIAYSIMFSSTTQEALQVGVKTVGEEYRARESVIETIRLFDYARSEITFSIFSTYDEKKWFSNYGTQEDYDFHDDICFKAITGTEKNKVLVLDNPQEYIKKEKRRTVHSFVYRIWGIYSLEQIGYLVVDVDRSYFNEFYDAWPAYADAVCIFSDSGEIIYRVPEQEDVSGLWEEIRNTNEGKVRYDDMDVIFRTSEVTGWKLAHIISNQKLTAQITRANYLFLAAYIVLFSILAALSYAFSRRLTGPLRELTSEMQKVRDGQFHTRIKNHSSDEIGILTRTYNSMIQRIVHLVNRVQTSDYIQKETELKVLQQQINPHFLYNTLEMISGMAACGENENIIKVSGQLADMFRYNLGTEEFVSVREEIEQIKNYVGIMQFRLSTSFNVEYDIDDNLLDHKILRFIMQPFVENAIGHGFISSTDKGLLTIKVSKAKDKIKFVIKDNGAGIPAAELKALKQHIESQKNTPEHYYDSGKYIGIGNVHHRLLLTYRDNYEFKLESKKNQGTTITIILSPK